MQQQNQNSVAVNRKLSDSELATQAYAKESFKKVTAATSDKALQLALMMVFASINLRVRGQLPYALIPNIKGSSSTGKTMGLRLAAKNLGWDVEVLKVAGIQEVEALLGYIAPGSNPGDAVHAVPGWIRKAEESSRAGRTFLLILDDLTRTKNSQLIHALLDLGETGSFNTVSLPSNVHVVVTTNPNDLNYNVTDEDDAQMNRYAEIPHGTDFSSIAEIAEEQDWPTAALLAMSESRVEYTINPPTINPRKPNKRTAALLARMDPFLEQFDHAYRESILNNWGGPSYATRRLVGNTQFSALLPRELLGSLDQTSIKRHFQTCTQNGHAESVLASFYLLGQFIVRNPDEAKPVNVSDRLAWLMTEFASDTEVMWNQIMATPSISLPLLQAVKNGLQIRGASSQVVATLIASIQDTNNEMRADG